MAAIITVADLPESVRSATEPETLALMVDGANAKATRVAPCLDHAPTDGQLAEARLVLVGAIKRWTEAGSGAVSQQTAGPFGMTVDTRQRGGWNLWPSEIDQLEQLCAESGGGDAFSVDTAPDGGTCHRPWCAVFFNASYCSCGVDIAGEPIFEQA